MRVARGEKALPEDGKVDAVECRLSGGGGAGRFGRVRVCGTTGAAEKGQSGKTYGNKNRKGKQRKRKCQEVKKLCWCNPAYLWQSQTSYLPLHRSH